MSNIKCNPGITVLAESPQEVFAGGNKHIIEESPSDRQSNGKVQRLCSCYFCVSVMTEVSPGPAIPGTSSALPIIWSDCFLKPFHRFLAQSHVGDTV